MSAKVRTGLDILRDGDFCRLGRRRVGLLVHPASVDSNLDHAFELFRASRNVRLARLFGPQHGIRGETQDNMIEWEGFTEPETGLQVVSLYGAHRKPTPEMLEGLDVLVVDLQDVGARPYTFNWTMLLCLEACAEKGVKVMVLDRPNPVGPAAREGHVLDMEYKSFVGLAPIPLVHGMTYGELAVFCNRLLPKPAELEVVWMEGYRRSMWFEQTGLPWVLPSPNLPTMDSAVAYPGFVLLEATNLSEGRGTTRPFELFGAPFMDPGKLVRALESWDLPGVRFRPTWFQPTFQKWGGQVCGGVQLHVTDRAAFRSVQTAATALRTARELWPKEFEWKQPPYEYEREKLPIDILAGDARLREAVDAGKAPLEIAHDWEAEVSAFAGVARETLHYA